MKPLVWRVNATLGRPTSTDKTADRERLISALKLDHLNIPLSILKDLPQVLLTFRLFTKEFYE